MSRGIRQPANAAQPSEPLIAAVNRLADEVTTLHEVIEQFRECFEWAVHNNAFRSPQEEAQRQAAGGHYDSTAGEPSGAAGDLPTEELDGVRASVETLHSEQASLWRELTEIREMLKQMIPAKQRSLFPPE